MSDLLRRALTERPSVSFIALITFDLNYPAMSPHGTNVYKKITAALENLEFYKSRMGKQREFELPSNTYIAEFQLEANEKPQSLVDGIRTDLKKIFDQLDVKGKFFVVAGRQWAWAASESKS
jgi:hypothetical protein